MTAFAGLIACVQTNAFAFACLQPVVLSGNTMLITSPFGWRFGANPNAPHKWQFHYGTDFSKTTLNTKMVIAPITGKYMSYPGTAGCGNMVTILQDDGFGVKFCHLRAFEKDPATNNQRLNGTTINIGDKVGVPSNTGILPAAEHIHLEVISKGNIATTAAKRIPPPFCSGVNFNVAPGKKIPPDTLVRPAGITDSDVYSSPGTNFDKAFYDHYMAEGAGSGTVPSKSISTDTSQATQAGLEASGNNASNQPLILASMAPEEMAFSEMILAEAKKRFGSEAWFADLSQKTELPLWYELSVMSGYQIYMSYQKYEIQGNIAQLASVRTTLLNEIAHNLRVKALQEAAQRRINIH